MTERLEIRSTGDVWANNLEVATIKSDNPFMGSILAGVYEREGYGEIFALESEIDDLNSEIGDLGDELEEERDHIETLERAAKDATGILTELQMNAGDDGDLKLKLQEAIDALK